METQIYQDFRDILRKIAWKWSKVGFVIPFGEQTYKNAYINVTVIKPVKFDFRVHLMIRDEKLFVKVQQFHRNVWEVIYEESYPKRTIGIGVGVVARLCREFSNQIYNAELIVEPTKIAA
jgi:hypothetical protein